VRRRRLAALVPCGLLRWCPAACCAAALRLAALLRETAFRPLRAPVSDWPAHRM